MSALTRKLMGTSGAGGGLNVADVFSTDPYTGNGSTQTITNGLDLAGKGGLVWIKNRSSSNHHSLVDTERGVIKELISSSANAESTVLGTVTSFGVEGFSLGSDGAVNGSGLTYAAWTFRKAPKFFDVVTYTGDGTVSRTIPHNLGVEPGMIVVKGRNISFNWAVYHRSNTAAPETEEIYLNQTSATADNNLTWHDTAPTDSVFTVGSSALVNGSGSTYVAYLFAHDPEPDGVIQCGSYTGNGSATGPVINLGWEPQWLLIKRSDSTGGWVIRDSERSPSNPRDDLIQAQESDAELSNNADRVNFLSTGFQPVSTINNSNASGGSYTYVAIRAEGA